MIDIPRVLTQQLYSVDEVHGKLLCLAYARHAMHECRSMLSPAELGSALAYLQIAESLFSGEGTMAALADARRGYFTVKVNGSRVAEQITWISVIAVSACWQQEMMREGIVHGQFDRIDVRTVAHEGQRVVTLPHDQSTMEGQAQATRARWEEARWQLIHLLESAPYRA
ncbi:hypothetical protein JOF56_007203 [Kibdelosporangium banguiense]|uniref:Uncharacterized protein n=1 Tax=Kibdelosporangium banguiense TaxID=1365924 RepID=A0ABS4TQY2_9PSEU|nr:hypothetical protein [Kibdelosporangium banguiense]MBP2326818.1 hypothetical protein [Kibdelosporangium banguiense]